MKALLLNLFCIAIVMTAGVSMAQYPELTEEEIQALEGYNALVPPVEFAETPNACEEGDTECEALYLDLYGAHFQGFMQAQQHPSPVYSWEAGKCILNNDQCGTLQGEWDAWVNKANVGGLDFSQGSNVGATPQCKEGEELVITWFGLQPAYKCYQKK